MSRIPVTAPVLAAMACLAAPLAAQEGAPPPPPAPGPSEPGTSLIEEGAKMFLRGLLNEFGPQIDGLDLSGRLEFLRQLADVLHEFDQFEPPLVLPNGDILIRRKPPAPPGAEETGPAGETEI